MSLLNNPYYLQTCHNLLLSGLLLINRWPLWIQMRYTGTLYYVLLLVYLANNKSFKWIATLTTPASNKFQSMSHLTKAETITIEHRGTMKDHHTGKRIKTGQRPVVIRNTSRIQMATSLLIRESTVKPGLQTTSIEWLYQCYKQLFPSLKSKIFSVIHSLLRGHLFK